MTISELCEQSHEQAISKGFWLINPDGSLKERNEGELIALMHSELSEALEGLRHGNPSSEHIPEFSSVEEEMADLAIRLGDFCKARNIRLEEAIISKLEYNQTRPHKHGKNF